MKEYTLNEKQIKELVDKAFKLGLDYALDAVKREYDFKSEDGFGYNKIDHPGYAKNILITDVLIKTNEHYIEVMNEGKFNLFEA
jgi:hypothetical protein